MIDYSVYLVTDDPSRYAGNWLDNVVAAVEGGVTCVQYRDTESAPRERYARARALRDALAGRVPLVVNNDAELAAAIRAEGVHVGQHDLAPAAVRAIVGPACEIGLSITCLADLADRMRLAVVDALGIGPVFDARKTKADASDALGLAGLAEIVRFCEGARRETRDESRGEGAGRETRDESRENQTISNLKSNNSPALVAIGGITLANAAAVRATGARGLAVVSAFSKSADPFATARAFKSVVAAKDGARA